MVPSVPFFTPRLRSLLQEHDPVAGRKQALAALGFDRDISRQASPSRLQPIPRQRH